MNAASTVLDGKEIDITHAYVPEMLKHVAPPKNENVVLKAISDFFKWAFADVASIVIVRSLGTKKLEFIQPKDLTRVIGGGVVSGLLDSIAAINNNKKFDNLVQQLEQEKLQARSNSISSSPPSR